MTRTRSPATRRSTTVITVFLSAVAVLVVPVDLYVASSGADLRFSSDAPASVQLAILAPALIPAVAALLAWAVVRQRPDWGFRRVAWRTVGSAWLIGVLAAVLPFAVGWGTGLVSFAMSGVRRTAGEVPVPLFLLIVLVPAVLAYAALAFGEQLGWSSLLAARLLRERGPDATAVIVGTVWGLFHVPILLFVSGGADARVPVPWAVVMLVGQCIALAFPLVGLRARSGSIWPVLVLHGAFNAAFHLLAAPATKDSALGAWLLGEGGLLTTVVVALVVALTRPLWRADAA